MLPTSFDFALAAEQGPISYEEETHSDINSQQTIVAPRNQSTGAGIELLMQEDATRQAMIQNRSASNEFLYEKFQKHSCFRSPKADLDIQAMQENVEASIASFNRTNDSNQLYYTIVQIQYLLKAQLESSSPDAFDTAATLRQLTLSVATGDLKEMLGGSNPLQLMKDLIEIELSYQSLSSYLDQDLKALLTLAENYRKEDPSEGELIDELLLSLIESTCPSKEKLTLLLSGIQDRSYHLKGLIAAFKNNPFIYEFEERENAFEEILKHAETIRRPNLEIVLGIFECSISVVGIKDAEPVLMKAKQLARKLQGEEREEGFRKIIECEMRHNLPSALETHQELKSFSE
ncbi:MAG: hypothetical protein KDK96_08805 [Chlamydiia bacterium]|nr:hypothetical protein [Chlamydiia bacterium]